MTYSKIVIDYSSEKKNALTSLVFKIQTEAKMRQVNIHKDQRELSDNQIRI